MHGAPRDRASQHSAEKHGTTPSRHLVAPSRAASFDRCGFSATTSGRARDLRRHLARHARCSPAHASADVSPPGRPIAAAVASAPRTQRHDPSAITNRWTICNPPSTPRPDRLTTAGAAATWGGRTVARRGGRLSEISLLRQAGLSSATSAVDSPPGPLDSPPPAACGDREHRGRRWESAAAVELLLTQGAPRGGAFTLTHWRRKRSSSGLPFRRNSNGTEGPPLGPTATCQRCTTPPPCPGGSHARQTRVPPRTRTQ